MLVKQGMRPRPVSLSMARWDAKMTEDSQYLAPIMKEMLPTIRAFVVAFRETQNGYIRKTKALLANYGVLASEWAGYLAFANEVWAVPFSGETGAIEVAGLIAKWVARGLTQSVLEAIRTQVFNYGPPSSP